MYRLIASDMDETFLDAQHAVPAANVEALRRLRELGVLFVPSSGRPYPSIMHSLRDLDPSLLEGSYVISFNGGFINRYGDPKPLTTSGLDFDVACDLYRRGLELGLAMHTYTPNGDIYVTNLPKSEQEYVKTLSGIIDADDLAIEDLHDQGIVKLLYMSEDFGYLHELGEQMAGYAEEAGIDLTYSSGRYLEFNPHGINKGHGLRNLAKVLGIEVSETIGMGDSANDLEMIQAAGLGVGVANVTDDVRPSCDLVLDTPAAEGALAEVVERVIEPEHR